MLIASESPEQTTPATTDEPEAPLSIRDTMEKKPVAYHWLTAGLTVAQVFGKRFEDFQGQKKKRIKYLEFLFQALMTQNVPQLNLKGHFQLGEVLLPKSARG